MGDLLTAQCHPPHSHVSQEADLREAGGVSKRPEAIRYGVPSKQGWDGNSDPLKVGASGRFLRSLGDADLADVPESNIWVI